MDAMEGIFGSLTRRRGYSLLGAVFLFIAGLQLVFTRAVLEDSILQIMANGIGLIAWGLAGLTVAYGFSGERVGAAFASCPACAEPIRRTAVRCPRCTTDVHACEECGLLIPDDEMTCRYCGTEYERDAA